MNTINIQFEVKIRSCNSNNGFKYKPYVINKLLRKHAYFLGINDVEYNL